MKKVILVQIQSNHSEVLYPQVSFLEDECEIEILTTSKIAAIDVFDEYRSKGVKFSIVPEIKKKILFIRIGAIVKFLAVLSLLFKRADIVVFNSLTTKDCFIARCISRNTSVYGIIHNIESFIRKERLIRPLKGVIVLSDDVYRNSLEEYKDNPIVGKMSWFIPISKNLAAAWEKRRGKSGESPIRIGVIGNVLQDKRDYASLASAVIETADRNDGRYELLLLGRYSAAFNDFIPFEMRERLVTFNRYIPYEEMDELVSSCDALLYLIHPGLTYSEGYGKTKITGLSTILKTIPVLPIGSDSYIIDDFCRDEMITYPGARIDSFFRKVVDGEITLNLIEERRKNLRLDDYVFSKQKDRYLKILGIEG